MRYGRIINNEVLLKAMNVMFELLEHKNQVRTFDIDQNDAMYASLIYSASETILDKKFLLKVGDY